MVYVTLCDKGPVCAQGLLNHAPLKTLVLTGAQELLNHSVFALLSASFSSLGLGV